MDKIRKCNRTSSDKEDKVRLILMIEYLLPDVRFYCPLAASIIECAIVALKVAFHNESQIKIKWRPKKSVV